MTRIREFDVPVYQRAHFPRGSYKGSLQTRTVEKNVVSQLSAARAGAVDQPVDVAALEEPPGPFATRCILLRRRYRSICADAAQRSGRGKVEKLPPCWNMTTILLTLVMW